MNAHSDSWLIRLRGLVLIALVLGVSPAIAGASEGGSGPLAELNATEITARDLKTLHYMQNAHGQLDEWSFRLISRLRKGEGPRARDPIFDGRADLQVKKIAVTYAGYTHSEPLRQSLIALADAHEKRLRALQAMAASDVDINSFEKLNAPVQQLVAALLEWSERR